MKPCHFCKCVIVVNCDAADVSIKFPFAMQTLKLFKCESYYNAYVISVRVCHTAIAEVNLSSKSGDN